MVLVIAFVAVGTMNAGSDDKALIKAAFEQMWEDDNAFSPELKQLLEEDRAISEKYDIMPCVEYDMWIHNMGVCTEDTHEIIGITDVTDASATVYVKVTNCGGATIEQFLLIKVDGQWRVDDIVVDGISDKQELKNCLMAEKQHLTTVDRIVVVIGNKVRLRWSPEIKADNIVLDEHSRTQYFNKGDKFKYLADAGDFYEVSYNGEKAYISKQFTCLKDK